MDGKAIRYILGTALVLLVLAAAGALAFLYSGLYPIAANRPHLAVVRWSLTTLQQHSVRRAARGIEAPPLTDAALVRRGFELYQQECLVCHGAPGIERAQIGRGLNPNPPRLALAVAEWRDAEVYWIIKHGLKMAGMPAFETGHSETDLWALTAFVRRLPELSVEVYARMVAAAEGRLDPAPVEWVERDDPGYALLLARGDPERGRTLLGEFGCGACHVIPGVRRARGKTGPPLTRWAERHYIAGELINTPRNLVAWIVDPQAIEAGTVMTTLGVTPEQALDMAAYLYTLGKPPRALHAVRQAGR